MSVQKNMHDISATMVHLYEQLYKLAAAASSFYDEKLERFELGDDLKDVMKKTGYCASKLLESLDYPISKEARDATADAYRIKGKQFGFLKALREYKDKSDKHMPLPAELVPYIDNVLSAYKRLKSIDEPERQNLQYLTRIEKVAKELPSMPRKRTQEGEAGAETKPVAKVIAMVAVLALGFTMLGGLNNLQAASPEGALPSLNTGFFLLPGSVYITSLQMVLFMLAAAVVVMYLAGKSLGEW